MHGCQLRPKCPAVRPNRTNCILCISVMCSSLLDIAANGCQKGARCKNTDQAALAAHLRLQLHLATKGEVALCGCIAHGGGAAALEAPHVVGGRLQRRRHARAEGLLAQLRRSIRDVAQHGVHAAAARCTRHAGTSKAQSAHVLVTKCQTPANPLLPALCGMLTLNAPTLQSCRIITDQAACESGLALWCSICWYARSAALLALPAITLAKLALAQTLLCSLCFTCMPSHPRGAGQHIRSPPVPPVNPAISKPARTFTSSGTGTGTATGQTRNPSTRTLKSSYSAAPLLIATGKPGLGGHCLRHCSDTDTEESPWEPGTDLGTEQLEQSQVVLCKGQRGTPHFRLPRVWIRVRPRVGGGGARRRQSDVRCVMHSIVPHQPVVAEKSDSWG
jgi:hypothetical protein